MTTCGVCRAPSEGYHPECLELMLPSIEALTCEVCEQRITPHEYHVTTEPGWGIHHECPEGTP